MLLRVTFALLQLHLIQDYRKELFSPKQEWAITFLQNPAPHFCCAQMLLRKVKLYGAGQEQERFKDPTSSPSCFLTILLPA